MSQPILEVQNLSLTLQNKVVLEEVDFAVRPHDYLALIGPNGGGKTTLLKVVLGLLKPDRGRVLLKGREDADKGRFIGYLPQHSGIRDSFPLTVYDTVLMGLVERGQTGWWFSSRERKKVEEALEQVDMLDFKREPLQSLSGGERQRVFIARALVSDPELLLLDEPSSNIDPQARFCFYQFLSELKNRVTIIMVTHDLSLRATGVNKIACLNRWLILNTQPELSREMMELMYGRHEDHQCPMYQELRERDFQGTEI